MQELKLKEQKRVNRQLVMLGALIASPALRKEFNTKTLLSPSMRTAAEDLLGISEGKTTSENAHLFYKFLEEWLGVHLGGEKPVKAIAEAIRRDTLHDEVKRQSHIVANANENVIEEHIQRLSETLRSLSK